MLVNRLVVCNANKANLLLPFLHSYESRNVHIWLDFVLGLTDFIEKGKVFSLTRTFLQILVKIMLNCEKL